MASAHDVAAVILQRVDDVDALKLQKLLYYTQAWSLAVRGEPVFNEHLRAWRNGPAVPGVWRTYKDYESEPIPTTRGGDASKLTGEQLAVVDFALALFESLSGTELLELVHHDPAWQDAWKRRRYSDQGNEIIEPPLMERSARSMLTNPRVPDDIRRALDASAARVYEDAIAAGEFSDTGALARRARKAMSVALRDDW